MKGAIKKLSIEGFESIRELEEFELRNLNVLVGANGSGKSNFVQFFSMLMEMAAGNFQKFIMVRGGSDSFLYNGPKVTENIKARLEFNSHSDYSRGSNFYKFELTPTAQETYLIHEERKYVTTNWWPYGSPSEESRLKEFKDERSENDDRFRGVGYFVYESISNWMVYHFHDTGEKSPMRRSEIIQDNKKLRTNASNIAPFLYKMSVQNSMVEHYREIVKAVQLVIPFFDDFLLEPEKKGAAEKVALSWKQKGSDFPMQAYHLSDGSIRFICLATALLQPSPPSTIIIDEPELGLHPEAIRILGELIRDCSKRTQVIVATQSPLLLDQFEVEDIVVVKREDGQSTFNRLDRNEFDVWLEDYSVGELWTKNVIQGGTTHE